MFAWDDPLHPLACRILNVANIPMLPKGSGYYSIPVKLANGLTRIGCNLLHFNDRRESRAATLFNTHKLGGRKANALLLEVAREFQPEMILFGHADIITPETVAALREALPHAAVAQWNVDPLFEPDNVARIRSKIDLMDWTFVTTAGPSLAELGGGRHRVAFMPNPVDPSVERGMNFLKPREALDYDLLYAAGNPVFLRSYAGVTRPAGQIIAALEPHIPPMRVLMPGLGETPFATGARYDAALTSAAMGLNVSRRNDVYLYTSNRMPQMAGSGILTFVDRATGYGDVFGEDEFPFFDTEEELCAKLTEFHHDDAARRRVAEAGWRAYRREFSCTRVAAYLLAVIRGERAPLVDAWESL